MFNIQFNFNPETQEILNLRVTNLNKEPALYIKIEDNRLILTQDAIGALNVFPGERISINYYSVSPEETFPVIGKSELFTDATGGCKLTKSNTVSFKGNQRQTLMEYGIFFRLEPFKKWFKMVPVDFSDNENLAEEENDLKKIN